MLASYFLCVWQRNEDDVESNKSDAVGKKTSLVAPVSRANYSSKTSIKVSWDKVDGATGYQVYRATSKTGKYTIK